MSNHKHKQYSEKSVLPGLEIVFQLQLTPINNSQLILKLEILDKLRLVTFHATQRKCNVVTGSYQFRRNESSNDFDSQSIKINMFIT